MRNVLITALFGVVTVCATAQTGQKELTISKLSFLKGSWTGTIETVQEGGRESTSSKDITTEFSKKGKKIKYLWMYSDADGEEIKEKGKIKVSKDGRSVQFGSDRFEVSNFVPAPKEDRYRLILSKREGEGVTYRTSIFLSEGKLMISKDSRTSAEGAEYQTIRRLFLREE